MIILKAEDMCIGRLYMYKSYYGTNLERGYLKALTEKTATFVRSKGDLYSTDLDFKYFDYPCFKQQFIAEYNASVFNKYTKLQEQHKKELKDLLEGKTVYIKELNNDKIKKKIWNKFFKS